MRLNEAFRKRLLRWAVRVMKRPPDMVEKRNTHFERWVIGESRIFAVYLHRFLAGEAPGMHDHHYSNLSCVLSGGYVEGRADGPHFLEEGAIVFRRARTPHRVDLRDNIPAVSLFFCGPRLNKPRRCN